MTAETRLIDTTVLTNAQVREVEFVTLFNESVKKLVEMLGVTRKIPAAAGTALKAYVASGTLQRGDNVDEGDIIPLSQYTVNAVPYGELTLNKWRKSTSAEAIVKYGFDQAVSMTTDRMLKDVQSGIRSKFVSLLGNGQATAAGTGLQAALADAWGQLQIKFEDDEIESVFFLNPLDVADYLGKAQVSTQTAFGMTYIENFLGLGTVILNSSVTKGTFYATAKENIVLYYIAVNGADLGEAFNFTSDETGLIGIHETPDYDRMTANDTVVSGVCLFAERLDGVVVGTISPLA